MRQLSEKEFEATFTPPMIDITATAAEVVDVWSYLDEVFSFEYQNIDTAKWDVEYVYINQPESHQHILINTCMENIYLVVVVDILNKRIFGHHLLNLNQKFGLSH